MTARPLTRRELAVLVLARRLPTWTPAARPVRIFEALGVDLLWFRQELADVVRLPAAEAFDPITVRRLQRATSARTRGGPRTPAATR